MGHVPVHEAGLCGPPAWHCVAARMAAVSAGLRPRPSWTIADYTHRLILTQPGLAQQLGGYDNVERAVRENFVTAALLNESKTDLSQSSAELESFALTLGLPFRADEGLEGWCGRLAHGRPWFMSLATEIMITPGCHWAYRQLEQRSRSDVQHVWRMLGCVILGIFGLIVEGATMPGAVIAILTLGCYLGFCHALRRVTGDRNAMHIDLVWGLPRVSRKAGGTGATRESVDRQPQGDLAIGASR